MLKCMHKRNREEEMKTRKGAHKVKKTIYYKIVARTIENWKTGNVSKACKNKEMPIYNLQTPKNYFEKCFTLLKNLR